MESIGSSSPQRHEQRVLPLADLGAQPIADRFGGRARRGRATCSPGRRRARRARRKSPGRRRRRQRAQLPGQRFRVARLASRRASACRTAATTVAEPLLRARQRTTPGSSLGNSSRTRSSAQAGGEPGREGPDHQGAEQDRDRAARNPAMVTTDPTVARGHHAPQRIRESVGRGRRSAATVERQIFTRLLPVPVPRPPVPAPRPSFPFPAAPGQASSPTRTSDQLPRDLTLLGR